MTARPATIKHAKRLFFGSMFLGFVTAVAGLPWWSMPLVVLGFQATTEVPAAVIKEINEARKK